MADDPPEEASMDMFDLSKKKKKKKKDPSEKKEKKSKDKEGKKRAVGENETYTYQELLTRVMRKLNENNSGLQTNERFLIKPPQMMRVGTKKTLWVNFPDNCKTLNRDPQHVFQFFMAELGTEGSIDGKQSLLIRGKYLPKYIESLLRKYITEYVQCKMCGKPKTTLTRDSVSRLYFMHCQVFFSSSLCRFQFSTSYKFVPSIELWFKPNCSPYQGWFPRADPRRPSCHQERKAIEIADVLLHLAVVAFGNALLP
jgi:translation initiation factor 2 subunit 2